MWADRAVLLMYTYKVMKDDMVNFQNNKGIHLCSQCESQCESQNESQCESQYESQCEQNSAHCDSQYQMTSEFFSQSIHILLTIF